MPKATRRFKYGAIAVVIAVLLMSPASALAAAKKSTPKKPSGQASSTTGQSPTNISQAVTQSYNTDQTLDVGMIVALQSKQKNTVVPINSSNAASMLGVVVQPNTSTITLTPATTSKQQVYVAADGVYDVLVSNQDGNINVNDYITVSALSGVGMKAGATQGIVLGKAETAFDGTSNVVGTTTLKNTAGKSIKVSIGLIPVELNISNNPLKSKSAKYLPSFLEKAATAVSNKPVSAARIYVSLVVLAAASFLTANMLYSGIRSGMIAVGRNPLTKKSIMRSLIQTVFAGIVVFVVGLFGVYLLLKV